MPPQRIRGVAGCLAAVVLLGSLASFAATGTLITRQARIVLGVRALSGSEEAKSSPPSPMRLSVDPRSESVLEFDLLDADGDPFASIRLVAEERPRAVDLAHQVSLAAEVTLPDGRRVTANRAHAFDDTSTFLFELYRGEQPVVLVIEAAAEMQTVVSRTPSVGEAVLLDLEIQNVTDGKTVSLETNRLSTFVGHDVSYSFRLGDRPDSTTVDIMFTPLRLVGEIAEIEVVLTGKLATDDGLSVVSKKERWIASRGAQSVFPLESGDPPSGYRFLVTPMF